MDPLWKKLREAHIQRSHRLLDRWLCLIGASHLGCTNGIIGFHGYAKILVTWTEESFSLESDNLDLIRALSGANHLKGEVHVPIEACHDMSICFRISNLPIIIGSLIKLQIGLPKPKGKKPFQEIGIPVSLRPFEIYFVRSFGHVTPDLYLNGSEMLLANPNNKKIQIPLQNGPGHLPCLILVNNNSEFTILLKMVECTFPRKNQAKLICISILITINSLMFVLTRIAFFASGLLIIWAKPTWMFTSPVTQKSRDE